jgi:adenosylhomocysteine nucleosidase
MKSIGILVAMRDELAPLKKLFNLDQTGPGDFYCGRYQGLRLQVVLCGAGPVRAAQGAAQLARYGEPELLISVGLSGGLWHEACTGNMAVASSIETPGKPILNNAYPVKTSIPAFPMLTLPTVVTTRAEKQEVRQAYPDCWSIDMESYNLAEAATAAGLPWICLRAISDPWNQDLPLDFNQLINSQGQPSLPGILKSLASQPSKIPPLIKFARDVFHSRTCLVNGLTSILKELSQ